MTTSRKLRRHLAPVIAFAILAALAVAQTPAAASPGDSVRDWNLNASNALFNLGAASLAGNNIFTGVNFLSGSFSGDGSLLTGLTAANLAGLVPVSHGGTGAGTPTTARAALGAAGSGANSDITSLSGLIAPLSISQGGTAGTTASNALANCSERLVSRTSPVSATIEENDAAWFISDLRDWSSRRGRRFSGTERGAKQSACVGVAQALPAAQQGVCP